MSPPDRRHQRDFDKILGVDGQYIIHSAADDARADSHNMDTFGESIDTANEWVPLANPFPTRNIIEAEEIEARTRSTQRQERQRKHTPAAVEPVSRAPEVLNFTCSLLSSVTPARDTFITPTHDLSSIPVMHISSYIRPFTKADRLAISEGSEEPVWTPKLINGHPDLMTVRDREGIMKMHLTQMASSAASAVQDFRGKFILGARKNSEDDGKQKTAYASVHHPRKNLQGASNAAVVLGDKFSAMADVEDAIRLVLRAEAVDDFIKDLHPLAAEALENSFSARSELLAEAVGKIAENFASILSYRKGRALIDRIFSKLAAALNPGETPFAMRIRRIEAASFRVSLDTLDSLLSKFLVFGGSSDKLKEICEIFGKQYNACNRFGKNVEKVFAELSGDEISRFLINHPMGVQLFTNILPLYTKMTEVVTALCQSCERLHAKVTAAGSEEKLQDLWNLLVAVLQRANEDERILIQEKIGAFLQNKIQQ